MSVTQNFHRHFRALEAAMNIEGELTGTVSENFEKLFKLSDNRSFALQLADYSSSRLYFLRSAASHMPNMPIETMDISQSVTDLIFHQLVAASAHRYSRVPPKVHHWLPFSHTRHFTEIEPLGKGERKRRCNIQSLSFTSEGEAIEGEVNDKHFAHGVDSAGNGFYHLSVEYFFCKVESAAAEARDKISDTKSGGNESFLYAALTAFFVVQSVRNPHPGSKQFSIRTFAGVIEALIESLETIPKIFVSVPKVFSPKTRYRMVFTPYVPTRVRKLIDGNVVMAFPVSSHFGLTISQLPITRKQARNHAHASNTDVIKHARRTGSTIFGVGHKNI